MLFKLLSWFTILIGALFFLLGSWFFYYQVLQGRKQTEAEILSAELGTFQDTDEGKTTTKYRSKYEVTYNVEGRLFRRPLQGNLGTRNKQDVQTRLSKNPVGSRRPIYYLRTRPEDFTLEPLGRRIGVSLVFLTIGVTILGVGASLWMSAQPLEW